MSDYFQVSNPEDIAIRPLTKGMITNVAQAEQPDGSFLNINGFSVTERGPKRLGGWAPAIFGAAGLSVPVPLEIVGERIEDFIQVRLEDGSEKALLVTNRFLYTMSKDNGYQVVFFGPTHSAATVNLTGADAVITVAADLVALDVVADDYFWITKGGLIEKILIRTISAVAGTTTITLVGQLTTITLEDGDTFEILKPFRAESEWYVDWATSVDYVYLVDGFSPYVFRYGSLGYVESHQIHNTAGDRTMYGARTVCCFGNRLFFGDITEPYGAATLVYRHRIRWTSALDYSHSEAAYYQDLIQSRTPIIKLSGFNTTLVAYTYDKPFIGRQTNLTMLPYAFYEVESAGASLVGMKAVTSFLQGQIFVSTDDIYVLTEDEGVSRIGEKISRNTIERMVDGWRTVALTDIASNLIVIGISTIAGCINCHLLFNTKTRAWSINEDSRYLFQTLGKAQLLDIVTYADVDAIDAWTYENNPYTDMPYYALVVEPHASVLVGALQNNHLLEYDKEASSTTIPTDTLITVLPIHGSLETPDYDFGLIDTNKTVLRFSLALSENIEAGPRMGRILFILEWSSDKGRTWRRCGRLTFNPADEEDALNFRATAPIIRFRLRLEDGILATDNVVQPFVLGELALRVRKRGSQNHLLTARPEA